jgi:hypothetical protein
MTEMNKNYSKTNYPNIFKNTYWGKFNLLDNNYHISEDIFLNRNNFIETNNIKSCVQKRPYYIEVELNKLKKWDHIELYITNNNEYILVSSIYGNDYNDDYIKLNWSSTNKLYSIEAFTYIKIFPILSKKKDIINYLNC